MAKTRHNNISFARGDLEELPFGELIARLQEEGFTIDKNDYVEFAAVFENLQPATAEELKYYLAPIVCKSEEEQEKFYTTFDSFIKEKQNVTIISPRRSWTKRWWPWLAAGSIIFLAIIMGIQKYMAVPCAPDTAFIWFPNNSHYAKEPVILKRYSRIDEKSDTNCTTGNWDFGDGSNLVRGNTVAHIYNNPGIYNINLRVSSDNDDDVDNRTEKITICPARVNLINPSPEALFPGRQIEIFADSLDESINAAECFWVVSILELNSFDTVRNNKTKLAYPLRDTGNYAITFNYGNNCVLGEISFAVNPKNTYTLGVLPGGKPFESSLNVNPLFTVLMSLLALILVITGIYLYRKKQKPDTIQEPVNEENFDGMDGPFEIPFQQKDHHIQQLLDISKISYSLTRRTEAEIPYLDIPSTISNTIRNYGHITPAYSRKQRPREYLLLIDDSIPNNQQTHLFQYLLKNFINQNVLIDLYFFFNKPGLFYKENKRLPVNFQRLRDDNYQANLIVIGNGYNLLGNSGLDPDLKTEFEWWAQRVLITPVPAKNWSVNEQHLSQLFTLVPADIEGWISIAQFITEDHKSNKFIDPAWNTYSAKFLHSENVDALREYFGDEDLFQWLCSIAIHHNIRWEIVIEIGKVILNGNNTIHKLNYTNLLKLARIKWMEEGQFPASTRLELLKHLDVKNEVLARKAMIQLLSESDGLIDSLSFSYEEKTVQKLTDSFVIYANNSNANMSYKDDAERFIGLWQNGKIVDIPLTTYLERTGEWRTPINSPSGAASGIGLGEYVQEKEQLRIRESGKSLNTIKWFAAACFLLACIPIFGIVAAYNAKNENKIASFKKMNIIRETIPATADININVIADTCLRQYFENSSQFTVSLYNPETDRTFTSNISLSSIQSTDTAGKFRLSTIFKNVNIKNKSGSPATIKFNKDNDSVGISSNFNLVSNGLELRINSSNCGLDSLVIDYFPGSKDDYTRIGAQIKKAIPEMELNTTLSGRQTKKTCNYLVVGSMLDSLTIFSTASRLLKAGVTIKDIRMVAYTPNASAISGEGKRIEINGDDKLERLPPLSLDSLRCRLLNDCKEKAIQVVYVQFGEGFDRNTADRLWTFLGTNGYNTPTIEKRAFTYPSAVRYFLPEKRREALDLAAMTSAYLKRDIPVQYVAATGTNSTNRIEIWLKAISPTCPTIKLSDIREIRAGQKFSITDNSRRIDLEYNQITFFINNQAQSYLINPAIRKCGNRYTLYIMSPNRQQIPATYFGDSIVFSVSVGAINIQQGSRRGNYRLQELNKNFEGKNILWIDHSGANRSQIVQFRREGLIIIQARDNAIAMAYLNKDNFDLVITDMGKIIKLPEGLELLKEMRNMKLSAKVILYGSIQEQNNFEKEARPFGIEGFATNGAELRKVVNDYFKPKVSGN